MAIFWESPLMAGDAASIHFKRGGLESIWINPDSFRPARIGWVPVGDGLLIRCSCCLAVLASGAMIGSTGRSLAFCASRSTQHVGDAVEAQTLRVHAALARHVPAATHFGFVALVACGSELRRHPQCGLGIPKWRLMVSGGGQLSRASVMAKGRRT